MSGMTLKEYHKARFFNLLERYSQVKRQLPNQEAREAFIILSVQIHAAKAHVPKSLWPLVNKVARS